MAGNRGVLPRAPLTADFLALHLEFEAWGGTYRVQLLSTEGRSSNPRHHLRRRVTVTATTTAKVGQGLSSVRATAARSPAPRIAALWTPAPAGGGTL